MRTRWAASSTVFRTASAPTWRTLTITRRTIFSTIGCRTRWRSVRGLSVKVSLTTPSVTRCPMTSITTISRRYTTCCSSPAWVMALPALITIRMCCRRPPVTTASVFPRITAPMRRAAGRRWTTGGRNRTLPRRKARPVFPRTWYRGRRRFCCKPVCGVMAAATRTPRRTRAC